MGSDKAKPAYCEDVDDTSGREVRESRRTAAVVNTKVTYQEEPSRERRDRKSGKHRKSQSDATYPPEQSTSAQHVEIISPKDIKLERRKSTSSSTKSPRKSNRPPSAHENRSFSKLSIPSSSRVDASHFGIPPPTITRTAPAAVSQPIPFRPRATTSQTYQRPPSYHAAQTTSGGHGPPLSLSAYYQQQPIITPQPPSQSPGYIRFAAMPQPQAQPQYQYQQYPAPQYSTPPYSMSAQAQYPMPTQPDSYFQPQAVSRPLSSRFDPIPRSSSAFDPVARTTSAFGARDSRSRAPVSDYDPPYWDDGYASVADGATIRKSERRGSIRVPSSTSTMSKAEADSRAMPPPSARPGILRRTTEREYAADPKSDPGVGGYYDRDGRSEFREETVSRRRPSMNRHSASYDRGSVRVEAANSGRRRQSYYEQPSSAGGSSGFESKSAYEPKSTYEAKPSKAESHEGASSNYESKLNQAQSYQEDVAGGPTIPLTAEVLKRQQRRQGGSSRSTKSSASRDESDYKKSATTRTTRSGSGDNDENVTIKVIGQARVMVGGTQIDCADGGEIHVQRQKSLRNGSERSNSEYGAARIEDRQSRVSRPSGRSRMSSSGESYTRTPVYPREREQDSNYF